MTTQEILEAWFDPGFRFPLRDLCETLPAERREAIQARACTFLSWFPPGRSGEWYFHIIAEYLVVHVVRPYVVQARATMNRDPVCDPDVPIAELERRREEAARQAQEERPCPWGKAPHCLGRACVSFRVKDGACIKKQ